MSMLTEQVNAVLSAPIPFVITLLPIGLLMWQAFEWAYRAVLKKRTELYDLSRREVEHWKDMAERTASQVTEQIESLKAGGLPPEAKPKLDQLTHTTSMMTFQLAELGRANSASTPLGTWPGLLSLPQQPSSASRDKPLAKH
jgi:hypothetical protein